MTPEKQLREKFAQVEGYLPQKYAPTICSRMQKYSPPYVRKVRTEKAFNMEIMTELIKLAEERRAAVDNLLK